MASRRKQLLTRLIIVVGVLVIVTTVGWLLIRPRLFASMGYVVADEFSRMPADDVALVEWLKQQPGVVEHAVYAHREGKTLKVDFIQVKNLAGSPQFPALDERAGELGYQGGHGFRDDR